MKYICLLVLFISIASTTALLRIRVSAKSNIKHKLKDFVGCDLTRESLIKPQCIIEGAEEEDRQKMCDEYTKDLEKSLDCKDDCKTFYEKLNKSNIKYAESQAKYFKGKKDKDRAERSKKFAKDQKDQEEAFIQSHCFADLPAAEEEEKKE